MFNKQSNNSPTHKTTNKSDPIRATFQYIKKRFLVSPFIAFLFLPLQSFSFSLDTAILDLYNQAIHSKSLHTFPKAKESGNLFKQLYQSNQQNIIISHQQGLEQTYLSIKQQGAGDCSTLEKNHIHDILYRSNSTYRNKLLTTIQEQLPTSNIRKTQGKNNLSNACQQLITCIDQKTTEEQAQNQQNSLSRESISNCTEITNTLYSQAQSYAHAHAQLTQINEGDQRYENGTLKDGGFDLLLDIQNIGELLFSNNKQVPELLYYQLPTRDSLPQDEANDTNTQTGTRRREPSVQNMNIGHSAQPTNLPYSTKKEPNNSISGNNTDTIIQDVLTPNNPQSIPTSTLPVDLFGPQRCLTGQENNNQETSPIGPDRTSYQDEIDEYTDTFDPIDDRINDYLSSPTNNGSGSTTGNNTDPINYDPGTLQDQDIYQSCKAQCNNLGFADQILCMAQCLCDIWPQDPNIPQRAEVIDLKVRFCMIPAQSTTSIITHQNVMSIEQIIDQINNILSTLQASGQMGKSNHTTEFLDSSLQNIKLQELVVFNLAIAFKPIFDGIPDLIIEKERTHKNIAKEEAILGSNNNNKYLSMADASEEKAKRQTAISPSHYQQIYQQQKAIQTAGQTQREYNGFDAKLNNFSTTEQVINTFLTNNHIFRAEINKLMINIQEITLSLKNKI